MFFIPLNQLESVELVINALRIAGGEADCTSCPAARVCTRQCLTIANAISSLAEQGLLSPEGEPPPEKPDGGGSGKGAAKGGLRVVK